MTGRCQVCQSCLQLPTADMESTRQKYLCIFDSCQQKVFSTKYGWKRHLLKEHATALVPQYMCEFCALGFSSVDKYQERLQLIEEKQEQEGIRPRRGQGKHIKAPVIHEAESEEEVKKEENLLDNFNPDFLSSH